MKNEETLALHLADNTLILGQRLGEWCGNGPAIEEDIALTNIALDYIGQTSILYKHLCEAIPDGKDEDDYAFLRTEREYKNFILCELPIGDYAFTIARQYLFSQWYILYLEALQQSSITFFQEFAAKSIKEVRYHLQHGQDWVIRLGDGTEESKSRMQNALNSIWNYSGEMFIDDANDAALVERGVCPANSSLKAAWTNHVEATLAEAGLTVPTSGWMHSGGRKGLHSEHMGHLLSEMQYMQRSYPNSEW